MRLHIADIRERLTAIENCAETAPKDSVTFDFLIHMLLMDFVLSLVKGTGDYAVRARAVEIATRISAVQKKRLGIPND